MTLPRLVLLFAFAALASAGARAAEDYSPAERALFMTKHLAALKSPTTLRYAYKKSGTLEPGFDDTVTITLAARPGGGCCDARGAFLSGAHRLDLPAVEAAQSNPALLYFLERDIREMERLTKGKANYFRKRVRMALYQGAKVEAVSVPWRGAQVAAQRVTITPYLDDPLRARFEKYAGKQYVFTLSDAVPGGIHSLRTRIDAGGEPLLQEELLLEAALTP